MNAVRASALAVLALHRNGGEQLYALGVGVQGHVNVVAYAEAGGFAQGLRDDDALGVAPFVQLGGGHGEPLVSRGGQDRF